MKRPREPSQQSQRGIGAFLTGASAEKYAEARLPKRGRPAKSKAALVGGVSTFDDDLPLQQQATTILDAVIEISENPASQGRIHDASATTRHCSAGAYGNASNDTQASLFFDTMLPLAKAERQRLARQATARARQQVEAADAEAANSSKVVRRRLREAEEETPTTRLWEQITNSPALAENLEEYVALAELVIVMVPGSVEDERRFSAMSFIQDSTRNRLDEHLSLCVRMFTQELFDLDTFPFEAALEKWKGASKRGRYRINH